MRIALFFNLPSGGAKRAVYEWTRQLVKRHHIDVYTLGSADHDFCDIRPFVQKYEIYDFERFPLFESPYGRLNQLQRWRDLGSLSSVHKHIAEEVNAGDYDAVFANTSMYTFIPILARYVEAPIVYYLHEPFGRAVDRNVSRPYQSNHRARRVLDRFDPLIRLYRRRLDVLQVESVQATDYLLANSTFTQRRMKEAYGVDSFICRLGVDSDVFAPVQGVSRESHVLSVGELSPRKGFDFLIDSLGYIPASKRPKLRIACNSVLSQEMDYIKILAGEKGVDLEVITDQNIEKLISEYNTAALCLYAPVLEPFGLVPLEAMACGTPVVGVREGGVAESIVHEQTGLLVERDAQQFADAVQYLLSNRSVAGEFGRNGREYVLANWTWAQSVAALEGYLVDSSRLDYVV